MFFYMPHGNIYIRYFLIDCNTSRDTSSKYIFGGFIRKFGRVAVAESAAVSVM